tara:strand:- start:37 stop:1611 length:1575 start_codon:yes stop_codon:yes gene_type:complete
MAQGEEIVLNVKSDIGKVVEQTEKLEGATKKGKKGFKGLGTAIKGVGTAIKAAGIGVIVALLAKLMEVFSSNQKVLDAFDTAMTALNIAFNDLFNFLSNNVGAFTGFFKDIFENPKQALEDFADMIQNNLIERFNSLLDTFGYVGSALGALFKGNFKEAGEFAKMAGKEMVDVATGVDNSFDKTIATVTKATTAITDYTKKVVNNAQAITETNKAAKLAAVQFAELNAQYLKDAEIQRQIRDDETKSFAERIEANNKLSEILEEQQELQREQIQIGIDAAQAQYDINQNLENEIALKEEKVRMLELEETITGQLSEQKTNAVALEKELLESTKELRAEGMSGMERELQELKDSYELKLKMAKKAGKDTTDITKLYEGQKSAIVRENVNEQLEAFSGLASGLSALAGDNKELAVASAIIDTFVGANKAFAQGGVVGYVTAAGVIATGLANVRTIMQTDTGGAGGGGGGGSVGGGAVPQTPAPQMMSGAFELSGGVEPEATRAYVVTDEMTNSQNQLANIRRRATI